MSVELDCPVEILHESRHRLHEGDARSTVQPLGDARSTVQPLGEGDGATPERQANAKQNHIFWMNKALRTPASNPSKKNTFYMTPSDIMPATTTTILICLLLLLQVTLTQAAGSSSVTISDFVDRTPEICQVTHTPNIDALFFFKLFFSFIGPTTDN